MATTIATPAPVAAPAVAPAPAAAPAPVAAPAAAPAPAPVAAPAAAPAPEAAKPRSLSLKGKLATYIRRESVVSWWAAGRKFGHPQLFGSRFQQRSLTHSAYRQLVADLSKKGVTLNTGLNFVDSHCYSVPKELSPHVVDAAGKEKVGGGESGVIDFTFSAVHVRPGSYMLLAATEAIITYFLQRLVETMRAKRSPTPKDTTKHTVQLAHVAEMLQGAKDPILRYAAQFYTKWASSSHYIDVPRTGKKPGVKRVRSPLTLTAPDTGAVIGANKKYLIDKILSARAESMKKRGQALHQKMVEAGKIKQKAPKPAAAAAPVEEGKKKRAVASTKSDLQRAIESDKQKSKDDSSDERRLRPIDEGYDITPLLSQKDLIKTLLARIPESAGLIGKITPDVRRLVDDLFNEILITLTNVAISGMALAESNTMTKTIAYSAINTFFDVMCGSDASELRCAATAFANDVNLLYEQIMQKRRKRSPASKKDAAADEESDDDDEEDDAVSETEAK